MPSPYQLPAWNASAPAESLQSVYQWAIQNAEMQIQWYAESLVKQKTDAWVLEFQNSISQLEKVLKTESDLRKPGGFKVIVSNAPDFESVSIRLNDTQRKELVGTTEGLIEAVPPGQYEVVAVGKKRGKVHKGSKVIEVQPNTIAAVELTLNN